ncbi:hypothetical protein CJ030_MR6G017552 [Morella rubra]|uniref:Uncharacterized protein n=1 Tax=Morella rubra TaxID=262757 RepID=A0A6A1V9T9_9ROSI|nr:hypothetical protein CJ030_MR6G017552 [Morella rubra]
MLRSFIDVADIDALVWTVTVRGVTFQLSPDILAAFMGMQRSIGAYPAVEMENKPVVEDIFHTFTGQDVVIVGPFIRQKYMLPFFCASTWDPCHLYGDLYDGIAVIPQYHSEHLACDVMEFLLGWPWIALRKVSPRLGHRLTDQLGGPMVVELKEIIQTIMEATHTLCMDLHTHLTTLKNNFALTKRDLREELNGM